jgi:hypothetical protein
VANTIKVARTSSRPLAIKQIFPFPEHKSNGNIYEIPITLCAGRVIIKKYLLYC